MSCSNDTAQTIRPGVITIEGDFTANRADDQTIIAQTLDPVGPVTVTFPESPREGDRLTLVAAGSLINLDANGNPISSGISSLPVGTGVEFIFAKPNSESDPCGPGEWVAI